MKTSPKPRPPVTGLTCANQGVASLDGIENLTAAVWLELNSNQIEDVTPLSHLTSLEWLHLSKNQIEDVTALAGLTALEMLYLNNNEIEDITALSGLTGLDLLQLESNQVVDLTALSGLTLLDSLFLDNNQVEDITVLSNLTALESLYLEGNQIADLTALSGLTSLIVLYLDDNQIVDLSPLSGLTPMYFSAKGQTVDLGSVAIEGAAANPVVDRNGDPVALSDLYEASSNTFTPTTLGAGTVTWDDGDQFTGTLSFAVVGASDSPGEDDGAGEENGTADSTGGTIPETGAPSSLLLFGIAGIVLLGTGVVLLGIRRTGRGLSIRRVS